MAGLLTNPLYLAIALMAAAGMGFAIQQGGTCMVSALDHLVTRRSPGKLAALAECGVWTSALGLGAMLAGLHFAASPGFPLGAATVAGGLFLGIGAWVNGACVFGSIARIGGRDWHYLLTPPGYLLGAMAHHAVRGDYSAPLAPAPMQSTGLLLALLVIASLGVSFAAWRRAGRGLAALWDYRHATLAIGLSFVVLAVLAGPWTYTEALARIAHGKAAPRWEDAALFAALLGGAIAGGRAAPGMARWSLHRALLCLTGGALMGLGGSLVPGGNDNLILVGLPGLQPHAWIAIGAMSLAITAGLLGSGAWRRLRAARSHGRAEVA